MVKKFWASSLFLKKSNIQISFLEIASALGVSERTAKRYIKKDLDSGFITRERTTYQCRKYKTPQIGRAHV